MEDLNEMQSQQNGSPDCPQENVVSNEMPQENVNNEELQPAAEQPAPVAVDNDTNTGAEPEPGKMPEANNEESPETNTNEEPETDYSAMSREELLAALNELLEGDITAIRNRASTIRNQFNTLNKEVERQAFEAFLAEGGNKDDYHPANDAVAEAFYAAYGRAARPD